MADERDFELLDDYLTNQMSEQDRSAFEQKLKADPDLQHEYALQKRLIQGIKQARISELKSMLNNVPVPPSGTGNALATKIILGTVATLIIAGAAYWFTRDDQSTTTSAPLITTEDVPSTAKTQETEALTESPKETSKAIEDQKVVEDKNQTSAGTEHSKPSLAKKPDPLSAPAAKSSDRTNGATETDIAPATSSLTVETEENNAQYSFHYQINDSKLLLYGPFDNNYEVMEFVINGKRAAFLHFKDQYYMLQESATRPMPLTAVTDQTLLKTLTDHRSRK